MRLNLNAITLLLLSSFAKAQDYKVKGGVVYKDKVEVATVTGKVGMIKGTDLTFFNSGAEILKVSDTFWKSDYPTIDQLTYYDIVFPQQNLTTQLIINHGFINEKQVIQYVLNEHGLHFYSDGLNQEEVEKLVSMDMSKEVEEYIRSKNELIDFMQTSLKGNSTLLDDVYSDILIQKIPGDRIAKYPEGSTHYIFKKVTKDQEQKYAEKDRAKLIGLLSYKRTETPLGGGIQVKEQLYVFKKLQEDKTYKDITFQYMNAAVVDLRSTFHEIFCFETGKKINYYGSYQDDLDTKLNKVVSTLIKQGFL